MNALKEVGNKLYKESYFLLSFLIFGSLCIKSFVLHLPPADVAFELVALIIVSVYTALRRVFLGLEVIRHSLKTRRMALIGAIVLALAMTIPIGVNNYAHYGNKYSGIFDVHYLAVLAITFISCLVPFLILYAIFCSLDKAAERKLEKKIHEHGEDED